MMSLHNQLGIFVVEVAELFFWLLSVKHHVRPYAVDFISYVSERLFPRAKNSKSKGFFKRIYLDLDLIWRSQEAPKRPIHSANQL